MKRIIEKDKLRRYLLKKFSVRKFVFKSIFRNSNFLKLIKWNAFLKLKDITKVNNSTVSTINRCLLTRNKKRFFKHTFLARHTYLKSIRFGFESGIKKVSW